MNKNSIVLLLRKFKVLSFVYLRRCVFINRQSTIDNRQFHNGFLLIEALVAIALLAMTLTGTLLYFQYHLHLVAYQRQKTEINNCMVAAMEYFTSLKPEDMLVSVPMSPIWNNPTKFNDNTATPGLYNTLSEGMPSPLDETVTCFRFSESPALQLRYTPSMTCDVACIDKTTGNLSTPYGYNYSVCTEAATPCGANERRDVKYRFSLLVSWKSPISNTDKSKQLTTFLLLTE